LGEKLSKEECQWLRQESGGNPGLLIEMLQSIKESKLKLAKVIESQTYPVNSSIQKLIEEHLDGLSDLDRAVLSAAAIFPTEIRPDLLEELSGFNTLELSKSAKKLQDSRILRMNNEIFPVGGYEFIHGMIRNYVLERMDPLEKRLFHQKAIVSIQQKFINRPGIETEIAQHYQAIGDQENALKYWLSAGKQALTSHSKNDVYVSYRNALKICLEMKNNYSPELFTELIRNWTGFAFEINDEVICEELFSICLREGENRRDNKLIGMGYSGLAWVEAYHGNLNQALEYIELALSLQNNKLDIFEQTQSHLRRGIIFTRYGKFSQAVVDFEWVQAITKSLDNEKAQQLTKTMIPNLVFAYCQIGEIHKARELAIKSLHDIQGIIETSTVVQIKASLVFVNFVSGEYLPALSLANSIESSLEKLNIKWWYIFLRTLKAQIYFMVGELAAGWQILSDMTTLSQTDPNYRVSLSYINYLQGDFYRQIGDLKSALSFYQSGIGQHENQFYILGDRLGASLVQDVLSETGRSRLEINEEIKEARENKYRLFENKARIARLQLSLKEIDEKTFKEESSEIEKSIIAMGQRSLIPNLFYLMGMRNLIKGNIDDGLIKLGEAYEEARKMNMIWMEITCLTQKIIFSKNKKEELEERKLINKYLLKLNLQANDNVFKSQIKKFVGIQKKLISHKNVNDVSTFLVYK